MEEHYYIRAGANVSGPLTARALKELAARGSVEPADEISKDGKKWVKAAEIRGLVGGSTTGAKTAPKAFDVFISYSKHNKLEADVICGKLEASGTRCWIAPRNIVPGTEWTEAIIEGIEQSRVMVLVFSEHANKSSQVRREVERAMNKEVPVIPFRVQDVTPSRALEYCLGTTHWFDAFDPPLEQHVQRLSDVVSRLAQKGAGDKPLATHSSERTDDAPIEFPAVGRESEADASSSGPAQAMAFLPKAVERETLGAAAPEAESVIVVSAIETPEKAKLVPAGAVAGKDQGANGTAERTGPEDASSAPFPGPGAHERSGVVAVNGRGRAIAKRRFVGVAILTLSFGSLAAVVMIYRQADPATAEYERAVTGLKEAVTRMEVRRQSPAYSKEHNPWWEARWESLNRDMRNLPQPSSDPLSYRKAAVAHNEVTREIDTLIAEMSQWLRLREDGAAEANVARADYAEAVRENETLMERWAHTMGMLLSSPYPHLEAQELARKASQGRPNRTPEDTAASYKEAVAALRASSAQLRRALAQVQEEERAGPQKSLEEARSKCTIAAAAYDDAQKRWRGRALTSSFDHTKSEAMAQVAMGAVRAPEVGDASSYLAAAERYREQTGAMESAIAQAMKEELAGAERLKGAIDAYEKGCNLEHSGQYADAVKWYQNAADGGSVRALGCLGAMYSEGRAGLIIDYRKAYAYFKAQADAGSAQGMLAVGLCYQNELGVAANRTEADKWFARALRQAEKDAPHDDTAMVVMGDIYNHGYGVASDPAKSRAWYLKAAGAGNLNGLVRLGSLEDDSAKALVYYRKAADAGSISACYLLGWTYAFDQSAQALWDEKTAMMWYRKGADAGHPYSMRDIGRLYATGTPSIKDRSQALAWYRKAAETGDRDCITWLAREYDAEPGADYAEAIKWYKKAAETGEIRSMKYVGDVFREGKKLKQDYQEAARWYSMAADAGDTDSMIKMGDLFARPDVKEKKYFATAMQWFQKAADAGNAGGMLRIGELYALGVGIDRDDVQALEWFRKAAEKGHGPAMTWLAKFYSEGRVVTKDEAKAKEWYRKGAAALDLDAMRWIAEHER